jgi:hypothetical protein
MRKSMRRLATACLCLLFGAHSGIAQAPTTLLAPFDPATLTTWTGDLNGDGAPDTVRRYVRQGYPERSHPPKPMQAGELAAWREAQRNFRESLELAAQEDSVRTGEKLDASTGSAWVLEVELSSSPGQPFDAWAAAPGSRPPPGPIRVERATQAMIDAGRRKGYRWSPGQDVLIIERPGEFDMLKFWNGESMPGFGVRKDPAP